MAVTQSSSISEWKRFVNRAGWRVNYPPRWHPSSCHACLDLSDPDVFIIFSGSYPDIGPDTGGVMIEHLADKPVDQNVDNWLKEVARDTVLSPIATEEWVSIDGARALRVRNRIPSGESENIYLLNGVRTFAIRFPADIRLGSYAIYQQMISTLRFAKR
jgi:hypothetical protein